MSIIKLNAIPSTNTFLRRLCLEKKVDDFTVVFTYNQTEGKGQRTSVWLSEKGKNLICSVYKDLGSLHLRHAFYLNIVVSHAVILTLQNLSIPKLSIKWPNDILSGNKKIGGILIENVLKGGRFNSSIIGVGLNVNQMQFVDLPQASSLKNCTGINYNIETLLKSFVEQLKLSFLFLKKDQYELLFNFYETHLFRKNKPSTFKNEKGELFSGYISGITQSGKLKVLLEDSIEKTFNLKEITLLY